MFSISIVTLCYGSYKSVISFVSQIQASANIHILWNFNSWGSGHLHKKCKTIV